MTFNKARVQALREQYQPGTRIKLNHMSDPYNPVEPGTCGTIQYIDDAGTLGVAWDNGRSLGLIPGEDSFSIMPPTQSLKLYMPMTVNVCWADEFGEDIGNDAEQLVDWQAVNYADIIKTAILREPEQGESKRGLMAYYSENDSINEKVLSCRFNVEVRDEKLWGVAECELREPFTASEMSKFIDLVAGQASDGFGESFEQRDLKDLDGNIINASLWSSDKTWTIQTEQERFGPNALPEVCLSTLPSSGELICVKRGESGYYPSDWETGDAQKNREIADYHNQQRGITSAQEEAMVGGSMFGWSSPAADPSRYEKLEAAASPGMDMSL